MIQVQSGGFFSKNYESQFGKPTWWTADKRNAYGRVMGKGILTNWGAGKSNCPTNKYETKYDRSFGRTGTAKTGCENGKKAMKSLPVDSIRKLTSSNYTNCDVIYAAREEASDQLEDAQGRLDRAGSLSRKTKRKAKLDITKWETALATLRTYYNSGGSTYFGCVKQIQEDEQRKTTEMLEALLNSRDEITGIDTQQLLITIGVGIVGLTFITLKFVK